MSDELQFWINENKKLQAEVDNLHFALANTEQKVVLLAARAELLIQQIQDLQLALAKAHDDN